MLKTVSILLLLTVVVSTVYSNDKRRKAEESPLDAAFYLLQKEKLEGRQWVDAARLKQAYFELGKYARVVQTINILESQGERVESFTNYSEKLLELGKRPEAKNFVVLALTNLDKKDYPGDRVLVKLIQNLIELDLEKEAVKIVRALPDDLEKERVSVATASALIKANKLQLAEKIIREHIFPHNSADQEIRARTALVYAQLKQIDRARKILDEFARNGFTGESDFDIENNRRFSLPWLWKAHLEAGETDLALELWSRYGDAQGFYEISLFLDDLIAYGQKERVRPFLLQMQANTEEFARAGVKVVEAYLKIGDVESALSAARTISDEDDNYSRQEAFMRLADHFIAAGRPDRAGEILDIAFERARRVVFEHDTMNSVGASSGSRKTIYLGGIYHRLMKLGRFEKALAAIDAVESDHWIAKSFVTQKLAHFARRQAKTLPRYRIHQIIARIRNVFTDEDEDYYPIRSKVLAAEIHAEIGERAKAVKLLTEALMEAKESCCYEDDFLFEAGMVFERQRLRADSNLRKVLREFID